MDRLRFRSLASGSSGNCYFLGNTSYGILIDAGVGVRNTRKFLKTMGLDYCHIWGIFVTHDHADHIKAVGAIGEKFHVPVYATRLVHEGIDRNYCVTQKLSSSRRFIETGDETVIGDFRVTAFPVSHDSSDSVGYSVQYKGFTFTFATDLGYVSDEAARYLVNSDCVVLEANYDEFMLENGPYPLVLQTRIKADTGHLCNMQAATFLAENYTERWKYVFLCHLSRENNMPELAFSTITGHLKDQMIPYEGRTEIVPLERTEPSRMYIFD